MGLFDKRQEVIIKMYLFDSFKMVELRINICTSRGSSHHRFRQQQDMEVEDQRKSPEVEEDVSAPKTQSLPCY